jgi:methylthioribose-1-phosphate isomerase
VIDPVIDRAGAELAVIARDLYRRGWLEGTSGNLSVRLPAPPDTALITASGRSKGRLTARDMVTVSTVTSRSSTPDGLIPSAETSIHSAVYREVPDCDAVIHAHSPHATAVAVLTARAGRASVRFADLELIKGLGVTDPRAVDIPVFPNWSDVPRIGQDVAAWLSGLDGHVVAPVFLLAHHGITAWGPSLETARNRLECVEAMCQLILLTGQAPRAIHPPEETSSL